MDKLQSSVDKLQDILDVKFNRHIKGKLDVYLPYHFFLTTKQMPVCNQFVANCNESNLFEPKYARLQFSLNSLDDDRFDDFTENFHIIDYEILNHISRTEGGVNGLYINYTTKLIEDSNAFEITIEISK